MQWAYERLLEALVHGTLSRDILYETDLASELELSRTPVREAMGRLEVEGFLERAPRGFRVRVLEPAELVHLYEARAALEVAITGAAAERRTPLELAQLEHLHLRTLESQDPEELDFVRIGFHKALWAAGHNPTVVELLEKLFLRIRVLDRRKSTEREEVAVARVEHGAVLDAVRAGDAHAAREHMTAHVDTTIARLLAQLAEVSGQPR